MGQKFRPLKRKWAIRGKSPRYFSPSGISLTSRQGEKTRTRSGTNHCFFNHRQRKGVRKWTYPAIPQHCYNTAFYSTLKRLVCTPTLHNNWYYNKRWQARFGSALKLGGTSVSNNIYTINLLGSRSSYRVGTSVEVANNAYCQQSHRRAL